MTHVCDSSRDFALFTQDRLCRCRAWFSRSTDRALFFRTWAVHVLSAMSFSPNDGLAMPWVRFIESNSSIASWTFERCLSSQCAAGTCPSCRPLAVVTSAPPYQDQWNHRVVLYSLKMALDRPDHRPLVRYIKKSSVCKCLVACTLKNFPSILTNPVLRQRRKWGMRYTNCNCLAAFPLMTYKPIEKSPKNHV